MFKALLNQKSCRNRTIAAVSEGERFCSSFELAEPTRRANFQRKKSGNAIHKSSRLRNSLRTIRNRKSRVSSSTILGTITRFTWSRCEPFVPCRANVTSCILLWYVLCVCVQVSLYVGGCGKSPPSRRLSNCHFLRSWKYNNRTQKTTRLNTTCRMWRSVKERLRGLKQPNYIKYKTEKRSAL